MNGHKIQFANLCSLPHQKIKPEPGDEDPLTLIFPAHFEDVPCQSGVNHIFEG